MREEQVQLVEPTVALEESFLSMVEEYRLAGEERYQHIEEIERGDFATYVRRLQEQAAGVGLQPGYVPASTFWMVRDGRRILGVSRLRHRLSRDLKITGGHIGYDIRPSERRKGYGTSILALTLPKAKALGLKRVLLTCLSDNASSARIIEKNGGVFQDEIFSRPMGGRLRRYWIEL